MNDKLRESINILWDRSCYKCGSYNCDMSCEAALAEQKPMLEMNPQKREWVGLTKEELAEIFANCDLDERGAVAHMVEVKLRNKNT
jgi:hypothetical protein